MLLATSAETGLAKAIDDCGATLLVVVFLGDIVVLALKGFAGGVLALALDDANAGCTLDNITEIVLGKVLLLLGGEVGHDGGQRSRRQTREGKLVDDMVANSRVGLEGHPEDLRSRRRHSRRRREWRLGPGLLLARRLTRSRNLTRSEQIGSNGAVERVGTLDTLEHLGRLCRYRSQPAGNVGAERSERVHDRIILLIRVVVFTITDLTAEAGSHIGAHADSNVSGIVLVLRELKLSIVLVDFNVTLSGEQSLEAAGARETSRRGALGRSNTRSATRRGSLENGLGTSLAGRRVPSGVGEMVKSPLGPLDEDTRALHVNYDLGALCFTGEAIALVQLPSTTLAMQLETIPAIADDFDLAGLERTRSSDEASPYVDAGDEAVSGDLVV